MAAAAGLKKLTAHSWSVVAQNRRLELLPVIVSGFLDTVAKRLAEHKAEVRTARALSAAQRDALTKALNAVAGRQGSHRLDRRREPFGRHDG